MSPAPSDLTAHHLAILVPDLARAERFYADVLGLPVVRRQAHAVWVQASGVIFMLEVGVKSNHRLPDDAGLLLWAFGIPADSKAAWRQHLVHNDIRIEGETTFSMYFRDPFGTRLALSHYPHPLS
jgi:glyoxylase I family protein